MKNQKEKTDERGDGKGRLEKSVRLEKEIEKKVKKELI